MYDATLGRFLQRDPAGYATGEVNLYGYAAGKPVNATDPSGRRTFVEQTGTSAADCKIKVTTKIDFKGEVANKANVDAIIAEIKKYWNGFRYNCCDVVFDIDFKIYGDLPAIGAPLQIRERPREDADQVMLMMGGPKETGWDQVVGKPDIGYKNQHSGIWYQQTMNHPKNFEWAPAHEFGHLLGLGDRYDKKTKRVHPGWEGNIMGAEFLPMDERNKEKKRTIVEQRNIDEFFSQVKTTESGQALKNYCCPPFPLDKRALMEIK